MNNPKITNLIVVFILGTAFLGCGNSSTPATPTATPSPPGKIGEPVVIGNMTVTVHSLEQIEPIGPTPAEGKMQVGVQLTIENNTEAERRISTYVMTKLGAKDEAGTNMVYTSDTTVEFAIGSDKRLPDIVAAGEAVIGYVGYEIPNDVTDLVLNFSDSPGGGISGTIFLAESTVTLIEEAKVATQAIDDLGKICVELAGSPVSEESATGLIQMLTISSDAYDSVEFDVTGYAASPTDEIETLVCSFVANDIVEECEYNVAGHPVPVKKVRRQVKRYVLLINLVAEQVVREKFFTGGLPELCPPSIDVDNSYYTPPIIGSSISEEDIFEWVQEHWTP